MSEPRFFRVGEVVRLKSGSPRLLVTEHSPDMARVTWFSAAGELRTAELEQRWLVEAT